MTDQHPLTNKALEDLENSLVEIVMGQPVLPSDFNLARAAADWQLKQVIEWLKTNTEDYLSEDYYSTYFLTEAFIEDLKQAMRPTTTEEDN